MKLGMKVPRFVRHDVAVVVLSALVAIPAEAASAYAEGPVISEFAASNGSGNDR
jgi:hypothetical protein